MFPGFKRILILPILIMYGVLTLWGVLGCVYGEPSFLCAKYKDHEPTYEQCRKWVSLPVPETPPIPVPLDE